MGLGPVLFKRFSKIELKVFRPFATKYCFQGLDLKITVRSKKYFTLEKILFDLRAISKISSYKLNCFIHKPSYRFSENYYKLFEQSLRNNQTPT